MLTIVDTDVSGEQTTFTHFGAFEQPSTDERDTVSRTIVLQLPVLTAKKAGLLNRAMKEYRYARSDACIYFQNNDPFEFNISDQNELVSQINSERQLKIASRQVAYAVRTVHQNYREYDQDPKASPPQANRADTLAIDRKGTRIFHQNGRYYLNVYTGLEDINLPLRSSDDPHHANVLPDPDTVPAQESKYQRRAGVPFKQLASSDFPGRTQRISTSTIQKRGPRQFTANLTFELAKQRERTYDPSEARYAVGVDRGRNQLAYAALYDSKQGHVSDWYNRAGDEVEHYMNEFAKRITEFQSSGVWDKMDSARERRYRYKQQIDYEIANAVVDLAREVNDAVTIVLEDLQGMSNLGSYTVENRRFSEWSYYRLGQFIEQKAAPYDIPVQRVKPGMTSQRCSRCGESDDTDRRGVHFVCNECQYEQHADANAAVNIAKKFFE